MSFQSRQDNITLCVEGTAISWCAFLKVEGQMSLRPKLYAKLCCFAR